MEEAFSLVALVLGLDVLGGRDVNLWKDACMYVRDRGRIWLSLLG